MDDKFIIDFLQKKFGHTEEFAKNIVGTVNDLVSKNYEENNQDEDFIKIIVWIVIAHIVDNALERGDNHGI